MKIESLEDDAVASIRKYIDTDENPVKIEKDIGLWATYGHGRALEQLIACREESKHGHNATSEDDNDTGGTDAVEPIHNQ